MSNFDDEVNQRKPHECCITGLLYYPNFPQFKYFDKEEFKDLKYLRRIHLDGNQLSVVIDHLFQRQKMLQYLGEKGGFFLTFRVTKVGVVI